MKSKILTIIGIVTIASLVIIRFIYYSRSEYPIGWYFGGLLISFLVGIGLSLTMYSSRESFNHSTPEEERGFYQLFIKIIAVIFFFLGLFLMIRYVKEIPNNAFDFGIAFFGAVVYGIPILILKIED